VNQEHPTSSWRDRILNGVLIGAVFVLIFRMVQPSTLEKLVGDEAPKVQSISTEGMAVSLEEFRGQHVVLDFWATWCPPCRRQMPVLQSIHDDRSLVDRVQVLSINVDEVGPSRERDVKAYLRENTLSLVTLLDAGDLARKYDISVLPSIIVVDQQGLVTHTGTGFHSRDKILEWINE
jgi:thiol-disulfide isomerase/thioredoxin